MNIIVDNREPLQFKNLFKPEITKYENLNLGDVIIQDLNKILIIFERKSLEDLLSSVKDNRYVEQLSRYNDIEIDNQYIYYIIEGNIDNYPSNSSEYKTIFSCIFTLSFKYNFKVILTNNIQGSYNIIDNFYNRFTDSDKNYSKIISLAKKSKIKKEDFSVYALNLIPSIGLTTSKRLLEKYNNNIYLLFQEYINNNNIFNNLILNNKKVSKSTLYNLKEFLNHILRLD